MKAIQDEWTNSGLTRTQKYYRRNKHVTQAYYRKRKYENLKRYLLEAAKNRAKKKSIEFSIQEEDIHIPKFCPILGLELTPSDGVATDFSPSLDRIDNTVGYVKNNIQVISNKANRLKGDATFEDIEKLYLWMKGFYGKSKT